MPIMQATTKEAKSVWKKDDREISEVVLRIDGKLLKAKTYSSAIANPGFVGEVETYEKTGRNGSETFVRQAPKEDGYKSNGSQLVGGSKPSQGRSNQGDNYTMYLSYAKDIAVALIGEGGFEPEVFKDTLQHVANGGDFLFNHHNSSEATPSVQSTDVFDKSELNGLFEADNKTEYIDDETSEKKVPTLET